MLREWAERAVKAYFESDDSKYARAKVAQAMWNLRHALEANLEQNKPDMHVYNTGAKRSQRMPRYDLIPAVAIRRLAERFTGDVDNTGKFTGGALKYGESNWEKGLPTSDVINHIINHLLNYQDHFREYLSAGIRQGFDGETLMNYVRENMMKESNIDDDLAGAMWGISVLMHQEQTKMFHDDKFELRK